MRYGDLYKDFANYNNLISKKFEVRIIIPY